MIDLPREAGILAGIRDGFAYLLRSGGGIVVLDLAVPTAPVLVAEVLLDEPMVDLSFEGNLAVASIEGRGLVTLDFTEPLAPHIVGQSNDTERLASVRVRGDRAIAVSGYPRELWLYSLADPAAPTLLARDQSGLERPVFSDGYIAAVRDYSNISILVSPLPNIIYPVARYFEAHLGESEITGNGDFLYVKGGGVLKIVEVRDAQTPTVVSTFRPAPVRIADYYTVPDTVIHVNVAGAFAYVATQYNQMIVLDVSDPRAPQTVNQMSAIRPFHRVHDGLAYAFGGGLKIYDLADPVHPALVGETSVPGGGLRFAVDPPLACSAGNGHLHVIDVSDPSAPQATASITIPTYVMGVALHGSYVYVTTDLSAISVYNLSDPSNPTRAHLRGEFYGPSFNGLQVRDGLLYAARHGGLWVGGLSDPLEPRLIARQTGLDDADGVGLFGDRAAVSALARGVSIVRLVLPGDVDGDRDVDLTDLTRSLAHYGEATDAGPAEGDFNCDGFADFDDLAILLSAFGTRR
jgi:hypothetical protein